MKGRCALAFGNVMGLLVGWFGAAVMAPPVDRDHGGIGLFEAHCLPLPRQLQNRLIARMTRMISHKSPVMQREGHEVLRLCDPVEVWRRLLREASLSMNVVLSRVAADGPDSETILAFSLPGRSVEAP